MTNQSLPPLEVYVHNSFLFKEYDPLKEPRSEGRLIGVRALQNQAPQFTVLLDTGALYTGLPLNALSFNENSNIVPLLKHIQMWDNISSSIEVITFDTLRYMSCTVKLTTGEIIKGDYLFTIDYVGENDLSRDAEHWKQTHMIRAEDGQLLLYPQYRIKFTDAALCDYTDGDLPDKHNTVNYTVE
jgi:hypothetical protein